MTQNLTKADVSRLLSNPSGAARAETAAKIARQFVGPSLSPRERQLAEDIIRVLTKDAEVRVREALSLNLKDCDDLPGDVASALARDVCTVALPVLLYSNVLSDADLIEIVRARDVDKQVAIAQRKSLSENVSLSLTEEGEEAAVAALMKNPGAAIGESSFQAALNRFAASAAVTEGMALRGVLPATIVERLVSHVSDSLRQYLVAEHEVPQAVADDLSIRSRERATVGLLGPCADESEAHELVVQLQASGRLTPSLVLRALCMGDLMFFEAALAALAGVSISNARVLAHDKGPLGLRAIYDKAHLPDALFAAFRTAVDVIHETQFDGQPGDLERYRCRVMERILTQFDHLGSIGNDNVEYLVDKLTKLETA
jgi:uncharacterized protein (DUF2336 family)